MIIFTRFRIILLADGPRQEVCLCKKGTRAAGMWVAAATKKLVKPYIWSKKCRKISEMYEVRIHNEKNEMKKENPFVSPHRRSRCHAR